MKAPIAYIQTEKQVERDVLEEFIKGVHKGCVADISEWNHRRTEPAVFYGVTPAGRAAYDAVVASGREHYYIDNGYFRSKWQGGDYYRITKNRPQHTGVGISDGTRWAKLKIELLPWKTSGLDAPVMIALQSDWWYERHGMSAKQFVRFAKDAAHACGIFSGRQFEVRPKFDNAEDVIAAIDRAAIVIAHSSNVMVDALVRGTNALPLAPCAAAGMRGPLTDQARVNWASVLADNQWNLDEIHRGLFVDAL